MKNIFYDFYPYSKDEEENIWGNCKIVLDTNVLLSIYGLNNDSREKLFELLNKINGNLLMPFQVGIEFYSNRLKKIDEYLKAQSNVKEEILNDLTKIKNKIINNHPQPFTLIKHINQLNESLIQVLDQASENISKSFEKSKEEELLKTIRDINKDYILEKIEKVYNGRINEQFTDEQLEKIYAEGRIRYKNEIPPGYEDLKEKKEPKCYGDLIIWKELIKFASNNKTNIIFVTNDIKEDWWFEDKGKKIARFELKKEFRENTNLLFEMFTYNEFIKVSAERFAVQNIESLQQQVVDLEKLAKDNKQSKLMSMSDLAMRDPSDKIFYEKYILNKERTVEIVNKLKPLLSDILIFDKTIYFDVLKRIERIAEENTPQILEMEIDVIRRFIIDTMEGKGTK